MRREVVAVNTAPDSENRMHGEEARRYGFASGLVPGVDVLAYLAHSGVDEWGSGWLGGGRLNGRLAAQADDLGLLGLDDLVLPFDPRLLRRQRPLQGVQALLHALRLGGRGRCRRADGRAQAGQEDGGSVHGRLA